MCKTGGTASKETAGRVGKLEGLRNTEKGGADMCKLGNCKKKQDEGCRQDREGIYKGTGV